MSGAPAEPCRSCPFRRPSNARGALMVYVIEHPGRDWPCHKGGGSCRGRKAFAEKVERILAEPEPPCGSI